MVYRVPGWRADLYFGERAVRLLLLLFVAFVVLPDGLAAAQRSQAFVLSDGTLKIRQQIVRLHGIYIPPTNRICRDSIRPARCASRAVLALDFRVDRFVTCDTLFRNRDGSVNAYCSVRDSGAQLGPDVDLGAWMLHQGWAVATPDAPFEYHTLERIARTQRRGIWGFQVDSLRFR